MHYAEQGDARGGPIILLTAGDSWFSFSRVLTPPRASGAYALDLAVTGKRTTRRRHQVAISPPMSSRSWTPSHRQGDVIGHRWHLR
jgi:hypothetical protein